MAMVPIDEARLKELLKSAVIEALEEHRDLMREIVQETIEEIALARAMDEGLGSERVARNEVFSILEGPQ